MRNCRSSAGSPVGGIAKVCLQMALWVCGVEGQRASKVVSCLPTSNRALSHRDAAITPSRAHRNHHSVIAGSFMTPPPTHTPARKRSRLPKGYRQMGLSQSYRGFSKPHCLLGGAQRLLIDFSFPATILPQPSQYGRQKSSRLHWAYLQLHLGGLSR
jgi:hypothetical protein